MLVVTLAVSSTLLLSVTAAAISGILRRRPGNRTCEVLCSIRLAAKYWSSAMTALLRCSGRLCTARRREQSASGRASGTVLPVLARDCVLTPRMSSPVTATLATEYLQPCVLWPASDLLGSPKYMCCRVGSAWFLLQPSLELHSVCSWLSQAYIGFLVSVVHTAIKSKSQCRQTGDCCPGKGHFQQAGSRYPCDAHGRVGTDRLLQLGDLSGFRHQIHTASKLAQQLFNAVCIICYTYERSCHCWYVSHVHNCIYITAIARLHIYTVFMG